MGNYKKPLKYDTAIKESEYLLVKKPSFHQDEG